MTDTDFIPCIGRFIDVQTNYLPLPETVFIRGRIANVETTSAGQVLKIVEVVQFGDGWQIRNPPTYDLDLRRIEERKVYLDARTWPDGTLELLLLDGRSAYIYDSTHLTHEPRKVLFSIKSFVESFAGF